MKNKKSRMLWPFVGIYAICAAIFLVAIFNIVVIQTVERSKWINLLDVHIQRDVVVYSDRGNIYSADGKLMASSVPEYTIAMDTYTESLRKKNGKLFFEYVDSLSLALSDYFQDRTQQEYKQLLLNGYARKNRNMKLYPHPINFKQLKDVKQMPLFNKGQNTGGLKVEVRSTREKPYGSLAMVTIGDIYQLKQEEVKKTEQKKTENSTDDQQVNTEEDTQGENKDDKKIDKKKKRKKCKERKKKGEEKKEEKKPKEKGREIGRKGLEAAYDDVLTGKPGIGIEKKVANRTTIILQKEPEKGCDLVTTIDIRLQDVAEAALLDELHRISAEEGYVVMMETKTGEIKAIVNMEWSEKQQKYLEQQNRVLTMMTEPGSTFKTASLMAAIDDGYVNINDSIDVGTGICYFYDKAMKDHNYKNGEPGTGYGKITVQNALEASSNVGISQLIVKHYGQKPEKFVNKLYKMGLNDTVSLGMKGVGKPNIRSPKDPKRTWYGTTLPWMSIGYEVQIPPIYTLTFYNAIANGGKMIQPLLVRSIVQDGEVIKQYKTKVMRERICSDNTLNQIKTALEGVVWSPNYATAKAAQSPYVRIAGKTGTAQIAHGLSGYSSGGKTHQVSFCGYFPADEPKYTCLCVIRKPGPGHYPSGGRMAGSVVKNIAEKTMAIKAIRTVEGICEDSTFHYQYPTFKRGMYAPLENVCELLDIDIVKPDNKTPAYDWARVQLQNDTLLTKSITVNKTLVPSVVGMGARDAVYAIEQTGMKAHLHGMGRVVSQSVNPGTSAVRGAMVYLELK